MHSNCRRLQYVGPSIRDLNCQRNHDHLTFLQTQKPKFKFCNLPVLIYIMESCNSALNKIRKGPKNKEYWSKLCGKSSTAVHMPWTNLRMEMSDFDAWYWDLIRRVRGKSICKFLDCGDIQVTRKTLSEVSHYS